MTRMGRWIDFKNDYKTMYSTFMESVWWVFKQLFEKGMVYKGFKVESSSLFECCEIEHCVVDAELCIVYPPCTFSMYMYMYAYIYVNSQHLVA